jgi:hypothetical protein
MTVAAHNRPPCRIGLLLDGREVSKNVCDFAAWASAQDGLRLTHVILTPREVRASWIDRFSFRLVGAIERLLLGRNARYRDYRRHYSLPPLTLVEFSPADPHENGRLAALGLDLVISFTADAPARAFAKATGGEVISLASESIDGFWPACSGGDTTGFEIRHFNANGEEQTLLRGRVATQYYYLLNQAALREKASHYLKAIVGRFAASGKAETLGFLAPEESGAPVYPTAAQSLLYLGRLLCRVGKRTVRKFLSVDYCWHVAVVACGWREAFQWRTRPYTIANPVGRYLADPFVISKDGRRVCFVEDYDLASSRGRISAYALDDNGASFIGVALAENFHLSFPYIFEYEGTLYMCPETSGAGDIRVYKCLEFPLRWTLEKIIMKDVSAVDTMLFEKGGKWWMLTNIDPAGLGDFQLELCVFSADSPLDDAWTPHPQNPVLVDATRARNGGLLREGEGLFRVAQRQGFDFYGKSTSVNEIVRIDDGNYIETLVAEVSPAFEPGAVGTHHLHSDGSITVLDFARLGRMR